MNRKHLSTLTAFSSKMVQSVKQRNYIVGKPISLAIHRHIKVHTLCVK